jgi:hypothetical protein
MREEYATKMRDLAERTMHGEPEFEVIHGMDGIPRMVKR